MDGVAAAPEIACNAKPIIAALKRIKKIRNGRDASADHIPSKSYRLMIGHIAVKKIPTAAIPSEFFGVMVPRS